MRKIRKRVFAAVLAAALLFTMPGTVSYAEAEDAQTEEVETDAGETAEEISANTVKEDSEECNCKTLCTEESINGDCPVCSVDISHCEGEKTENNSEKNKEDAEQGDTGDSRSLELQVALDEANVPESIDNADDFPAVSRLYVLGTEVVAGSVTSGEGWSYDKTSNTLTLENLTVTADNYPAGVKRFLEGNNTSRRLLNIYLKGINSIDSIAVNEHILCDNYLVMRITGDAGASLTLNGWVQGEFDLISGGITLTFNAPGATVLNYGMNIDNGAKVVFNCYYSDKFEHYFSVLSNTAGVISVKNESTLEINDENPLHQCNLMGFGPLTVEDSTLTLKNVYESGGGG